MKKSKEKIIAAVLLVILLTSTGKVALAAANDGWTEAAITEAAKDGAWEKWCMDWENIKNDWTQLSIAPGKDASELNFAWYCLEGETSPKIKVSRYQDMSDAKEFTGTQTSAVSGYLSNKVTIKNLDENTKYYYTYGTNGIWSEVLYFNTQSTSSFGFFLMGDPQIGSSSSNTTSKGEEQNQESAVRNDTFNWNNTLEKALKIMPNASFILSAGDQIQSRNKKATSEEAKIYTGNEIEYAGFLSPDILKRMPLASSIGNHDSLSGNYAYHFNTPNSSSLGKTAAGGDYYYSYGNSLFIMLNTNNTNIAEHEELIKEALDSNKDAVWKIVTLHQDIYGSGEHSNEPAIAELRYNLVPIFEKYDIDVVLTGHDHTYARSKILKGGKRDDSSFLSNDEYEEYFDKEFESSYTNLVDDEKYLNYLKSIEDENAVVTDLKIESGKTVNPDGILYITANSASGSKYYTNVPRQQSYIAERWQEDVPTFSTVNLDEVSLSISTYRTDNLEKIDETYTILKSLDKSNLNDLIKKAEEKDANIYSADSFKLLSDALINAKAVAAQADANSDIIEKAYTDLNTAMNSLVEKSIETKDKTVIAEEEKEEINDEKIFVDKVSTAKTSDEFNYYIFIVCAAISVVICVALTKRRIKSEKTK